MPIYEYACRDCGHEFEVLVRGEEKPVCPSCGRAKLTKKLSVPAAHTASLQPSCPAGGPGTCGMSNCCGQQCGLNQ
jgi:putative FmdB family regulatory protein